MADDDQVFDFSSDEFSKDDLVNALNDMVIEYKKLSDSFKDLKSDSKDFSKQTNETEVLKNRVFELSAENEKLKATVQSLSFENNRLNYIFKSWTQSGIALQQLHEQQRPAGCKSGLGYVENNPEESKIKNKMNFVKGKSADESADSHADQISQEEIDNLNEKYGQPFKDKPADESADSIAEQISQKEKESVNTQYVQPTDSMSSWLKPKKPKRIRCPGLAADQTSKRLPSQKYFSKTKRSSAGGTADGPKKFKILKMSNGRSIRIIKVWIPKGLMNLGLT